MVSENPRLILTGKVSRQLRKNKEHQQTNHKCDQERQNTFVNPADWFIRYIFDNKSCDGHRGRNHADHHRHSDDNGKPDRIVSKLHRYREENRSGQDHESHVIDKGSADKIDEKDYDNDQIGWYGQAERPGGNDAGNFGYDNEMAEHSRSPDQH